MEYKDYYQMLGLERGASLAEIKKAFRKLARQYHPDLSRAPDADARMKEMNEAYAVLSDPAKRAAYDRLGQDHQSGEAFRPPPDWDAGFEFTNRGFSPSETAEFSDFFAELFGRMGAGAGGFRNRGGHVEARGEDQHARVMLDIEDAFTGATRQIALRVPKVDNRGRVALHSRSLNVKIPRGVYEGQIIRLAGQGAPGIGGGAAGDLLLEVYFKPHSSLQAAGRDLHLSLPVTPWEAALGAVVEVALPAKSLKVRIPAGSQAGQQLRVRGKGIPSVPPGDLLIHIQVVLPSASSPKARELYETMARELAFDPRREGRG